MNWFIFRRITQPLAAETEKVNRRVSEGWKNNPMNISATMAISVRRFGVVEAAPPPFVLKLGNGSFVTISPAAKPAIRQMTPPDNGPDACPAWSLGGSTRITEATSPAATGVGKPVKNR